MEVIVNEQDFMKFMTSSRRIILPEEQINRRKVMQRYSGSCVGIPDLENNVSFGELAILDNVHCSLRVNGLVKQFDYSKLSFIYEPELCKRGTYS